MTKRFLENLHFQQSFITTFFFFSLIASCAVVAPKVSQIGVEHFLLEYPLTSWLVAYNYLCFSYISCSIKLLPFSKYYPVLLYGQTLLYVGVAFEFQDYGAAFLGLLPAVVGLILLSRLWSMSERAGEHRHQTYLYILTLTYGWFQYSSSDFITPSFGKSAHYFLPIFFGKIVGITLFPNLISSENSQGINFHNIFKKSALKTGENRSFNKQDDKDRFFFHDMINHLYGLSLKFTYRLSKGKGIELDEMSDTLNEVLALQSLMSDHFGYQHKNINHSLDIINFQQLRPLFHSQMNSFLEQKCHVDIIYSGIFDKSFNSPFEDPTIHFASFYRIFTNLLKNVREANAKNIEITFNGNHNCLYITMKNDFLHVYGDDYDLGEGLSRAIKGHRDMKVDYRGLGLAAIESLALKIGGKFDFKISSGRWISTFEIPYSEEVASKEDYFEAVKSNSLKLGKEKAA